MKPISLFTSSSCLICLLDITITTTTTTTLPTTTTTATATRPRTKRVNRCLKEEWREGGWRRGRQAHSRVKRNRGHNRCFQALRIQKTTILLRKKKNIKKNQCLLEGKMRRRGEYPIATVRTLSLREICIAAAPVSQSESRSSTCLCNAFYDWCTRPDSRFLGALHLTV